WVISAHANGPSSISNGALKGKTLLDMWQEHPELFGKASSNTDFPLLVKILDAQNDLSVQVHPDDAYAQRVVGEPYGKTECWYVLDSEADSEIVFEHKATSKTDFRQLIEKGAWDSLLNRVKVKKGDFFYVPSGTIHAIGKGIVILEIQQSSDITYRLYDYGRTDDTGKPRDLHIEEALDVTTIPHVSPTLKKAEIKKQDLVSTQLIEADYFTVYHWDLKGSVSTPVEADYLLLSVVEGEGEIVVNDRSFTLKKGDNFILPMSVNKYELNGDMKLIVAHE